MYLYLYSLQIVNKFDEAKLLYAQDFLFVKCEGLFGDGML